MLLPLTEKVTFKTMFQRGNRIQDPRRVRWRFKLDSEQVLKVSLSVVGLFTGHESFYAQMRKDGRITVPKIQRALLQDKRTQKTLEHHIIQVTLEPT